MPFAQAGGQHRSERKKPRVSVQGRVTGPHPEPRFESGPGGGVWSPLPSPHRSNRAASHKPTRSQASEPPALSDVLTGIDAQPLEMLVFPFAPTGNGMNPIFYSRSIRLCRPTLSTDPIISFASPPPSTPTCLAPGSEGTGGRPTRQGGRAQGPSPDDSKTIK